jgi:hypothetical protein
MDRIVEGNTDIQKSKDLRSGKTGRKTGSHTTGDKNGKPLRLNWQEVDSIYDTVFTMDTENAVGPRRLNDSLDTDSIPLTPGASRNRGDNPQSRTEFITWPAILELVNGRRLEIERARLFEPTMDDISIIRADGYVERVIPLRYVACIRKGQADTVPEGGGRGNPVMDVETIETVDGRSYTVAVPSYQKRENVLFGYDAGKKDKAGSQCKYIPVSNIRRRCLNRYFGEILLEKGLIDHDTLNKALAEYHKTRNIKIGRIIARQAKIPYPAVKRELGKAKKNRKGCRTGEILVNAGLVAEEQVSDALAYQENLRNLRIGQFLVSRGLIHEQEVCIALAEKFRLPFIDLAKQRVSRNTLTLLPMDFLARNEILPLSFDDNILTIAVPHPDSLDLREEILALCRCADIRFVLALPTHLRIILDKFGKTFVSA